MSDCCFGALFGIAIDSNYEDDKNTYNYNDSSNEISSTDSSGSNIIKVIIILLILTMVMTILFFDGDCNDGVLIADVNIVNKSRIHRRINDNCF